jgi:hypothetical protein
MDQIVTKAQLARKLNVSRARISQLSAEGLPVRPDGKVELQVALDWIANHVDRSRDAGRRKPPPASVTISQPLPAGGLDPMRAVAIARARKLLADAKRAERLERAQAGEYIEKRAAAEYAASFSGIVRDHALSQADRLAPVLAAVTDEKRIYEIIRQDNYRMLEKVSKAILDADLSRQEEAAQ